MKQKYVHALDLSLNSTGVCIFTNDGELVTSLTIDTHKETATKYKLRTIGKIFKQLMREYPVSVVVIEKGFTRYNLSTQAIFRVHGVANYLYYRYEQIYYEASTVKKIVGGKGNISKQLLLEKIQDKYPGISFGSLDESDAFAVGETYFIKKGN